MLRQSVVSLLALVSLTTAADLPTKKFLNMAAVKTMVSAAEAEAQKRNAQVAICIVDDGANILFLERADGAGLNALAMAQKKARYAAIYRRASAIAAEQLQAGHLDQLMAPDGFPNKGGLPLLVDGQTIGGVGVSGAKSDADELIAQAAVDGLLKK